MTILRQFHKQQCLWSPVKSFSDSADSDSGRSTIPMATLKRTLPVLAPPSFPAGGSGAWTPRGCLGTGPKKTFKRVWSSFWTICRQFDKLQCLWSSVKSFSDSADPDSGHSTIPLTTLKRTPVTGISASVIRRGEQWRLDVPGVSPEWVPRMPSSAFGADF